MAEHQSVVDAVKLEDNIKLAFANGDEEQTSGMLFKGSGVFDVWTDPEHRKGIWKQESVEDPVMMPGQIVTLPLPDGTKRTMKGEIMRLKPNDC